MALLKTRRSGLVALTLGLTAVVVWTEGCGRAPERHALSTRSLATRALAEYLASIPSVKHVVVWANPFAQQTGRPREIYAFDSAGQEGVRAGLQKTQLLDAVEYPALRPEALINPAALILDPTTTTPLSYLVAPDALDSLARTHPNCDAVISLIGIPVNVARTAFWRRTNGPALALLLPDLRMLGDAGAIQSAFRSGKVAAAILNKPGAPPESEPLSLGPAPEFQRRYLLLTAGTLDDTIKRYPQLF